MEGLGQTSLICQKGGGEDSKKSMNVVYSPFVPANAHGMYVLSSPPFATVFFTLEAQALCRVSSNIDGEGVCGYNHSAR